MCPYCRIKLEELEAPIITYGQFVRCKPKETKVLKWTCPKCKLLFEGVPE